MEPLACAVRKSSGLDVRPHSATRRRCVSRRLCPLGPRACASNLFARESCNQGQSDTHLVLTFSSAPALGKSGQIRIYDAADHHLVDTLDLAIPAGPDPSHRVAAPPATAFVQDPASPTTTTPAVRTSPVDLHNYQLTTIGGLADFHFHPVIIHGAVATIYPHNNVLRYGREYTVQIDPGVFPGVTKTKPGVSPPSRLLHPPIPLASSSQPMAAAISIRSRALSTSFPTIHRNG